ncbi:hypothetical protein DFH01_00190 [Falsiroseomonas bella]|uniref:Uncharacterized protein n=1 Tax=Falsiroseomonas bella TaxID=2184016 RepID=A0A317FJJ7_9PROT|nr:hypothetical protein DFH01_00190 [Falsiroseomonas bella]
MSVVSRMSVASRMSAMSRVSREGVFRDVRDMGGQSMSRPEALEIAGFQRVRDVRDMRDMG